MEILILSSIKDFTNADRKGLIRVKATEALFWSIALPGFAQVLNKKYVKGFIFVFLEIFINVQANFNTIIVHSFHGNIEAAIAEADYLWLMFYPCLYFFAMYDAFRDAGGGQKPYSFFPFVFCAYFVTVGTIYSPIFKIFDVYIGPVWLPILSVTPGLLVGLSLQSFFRNRLAQN